MRATYHTFPPHRPPPHLGREPLAELGFCETQYGCRPRVKYRYPRWGRGPFKATLVAVDLETTLTIDIWTMEGAGAKVLAHENTHRAISEHYYRDAGEIAERFAARLIGQQVALIDRSEREVDAELQAMLAEPLAGFMRETHDRCRMAQQRFDDITDHGRAPIANAVAMRQALADEADHWKLVQQARSATAAPAPKL